jgi:hypothetical protein
VQKILIYLAFLGFILTSTQGFSEEPRKAKWTYMVYQQADCNLESNSNYDLWEMSKVGSSDDVNIIVLSDRAEAYGGGDFFNLKDWTSAKILKVEKGKFQEIKDLGEVNMGDPKTITDFIEFTASLYPAENYALSFWDHGGGWIGFGGDESTVNHDVADVNELAQGIENGLKKAKIEKLAFLGFDACLMASWEVVNTLSPYADYFLGSEELEPFHGWDYTSLNILMTDDSATGKDLGLEFIRGFKAQAQEHKTFDKATLALIDLRKMPKLNELIGELAVQVTYMAGKKPVVIGRARNVSNEFGKSPDEQYSFHLIDIGDFATNLSQLNPHFDKLAEDVNNALSELVIEKLSGNKHVKATGLSVYFPRNKKYYRDEYKQLKVAKDWDWALEAYYSSGAKIKKENQARFINPNKKAFVEYDEDEGAIYIDGDLADECVDNVVYATVFTGAVGEDGVTRVVGEIKANFDEERMSSLVFLDTVYGIQKDIVAELYVEYTEIIFEHEGEELSDADYSIPFNYYPPGSDKPQKMVVFYSPHSDVTRYFIVNENGTVGEVRRSLGGKAAPILLTINEKGEKVWSETSGVLFDFTERFEFVGKKIKEKTIYLEIEAADYGGNTDSVFYIGPILTSQNLEDEVYTRVIQERERISLELPSSWRFSKTKTGFLLIAGRVTILLETYEFNGNSDDLLWEAEEEKKEISSVAKGVEINIEKIKFAGEDAFQVSHNLFDKGLDKAERIIYIAKDSMLYRFQVEDEDSREGKMNPAIERILLSIRFESSKDEN